MWLFRSTHKHIAQDTLSEYLDGRLQGRTLERVELQLSDCDACRQELDELRATVAMMQQLPMEAPRRSFVMSAPPPEPAPSRPIRPLRAPNWVYAGAASVAALAVVVTVAALAIGGLQSNLVMYDAAPQAISGESAIELAARPENMSRAAESESAPVSAAAAPPETATEFSFATGAPAGGGAAGFSAEPTPSTLAAAAPGAPPGRAAAGADGDSSVTTDSAAKTRSADEPALESALESIEEPAPIPEVAEGDLQDDVAISETSDWRNVLIVATVVLAVVFLATLVLWWNARRRNPV